MIYFDNACTSFPKPPEVVDSMRDYYLRIGSSPGRSGHSLALKAGRLVFEARESLSQLFHVPRSERLVFTCNATDALNLAIMGLLREGDHVITPSMEHNSVMRPLNYLLKKGIIDLSIVPCSEEGHIDLDALKRSIKKNTRLIAVNHASNVVGTIAPVGKIGKISGEIPFLVDAAQSAGAVRIDVEAMGIDLLAFTGHKSLYGPQGTGGLFVREGIDLKPLRLGGTGSKSDSWDHPNFLPDKYECGTPNTPGIVGLGEGVRFVLSQGIDEIRQHEMRLTRSLLEGLGDIEKITVYGPKNPYEQTPTVSINVKGREASEVGYRLDRQFEIMTRVGLHCNPGTHRTIGTFPHGTVRLSMGFFNTQEEVGQVLEALRDIATAP
ncbi:MAG: aminotransferase class V-fold PLP-dependent enzyme [Thermodesulfobacteriota bacterium]